MFYGSIITWDKRVRGPGSKVTSSCSPVWKNLVEQAAPMGLQCLSQHRLSPHKGPHRTHASFHSLLKGLPQLHTLQGWPHLPDVWLWHQGIASSGFWGVLSRTFPVGVRARNSEQMDGPWSGDHSLLSQAAMFLGRCPWFPGILTQNLDLEVIRRAYSLLQKGGKLLNFYTSLVPWKQLGFTFTEKHILIP